MTRMETILNSRKWTAIALIVLVAACIAGGFGLAKLSQAASGTSAADDAQKLVGTWTETTAGTEIAFSKDGTFSILGSAAATYSVDQSQKTITFDYKKAYGGETMTSTYTLSHNTLTLTNTSSGQSQTYQKKQSKGSNNN